MASRGSYELAPLEGSEEEDRPFLNEKRPWRSSSPVDMFNKVMAFINVILALTLATSLALLTYSWTASMDNCKDTANALEPYCSSCPKIPGGALRADFESNSPSARGSLSGYQEVQAGTSIPERIFGRSRSGVDFDTGHGRWGLSCAFTGGVCEVEPRISRKSVGARETCIRNFNVPSTTLPQHDSQILLSGEVLF